MELREEQTTLWFLINRLERGDLGPAGWTLEDSAELNFVIRKIDLFNFRFWQGAPPANTPYINKQDCCSNSLYGGESLYKLRENVSTIMEVSVTKYGETEDY